MKVPFSWLSDYVDTGLSPSDLAHRLTMAGLEAEQLTQIGAEWEKVYVGEVLSVTRHPDADKLVLADVAAGEHRLTVVTGAPNIAEGQKVALALAGARLIDAYADELKYKTLKPGNIRGIRSEGMVCSEKELGLSDEHEGILVLEDEAPAGMPLSDYLGDTVIEFEITPNLVHAFSVVGIAREAAAVAETSVRMPKEYDLSQAPQRDDLVRIEAPEVCSRYHAVVIDNVTVAPSPTWLARHLQAAGVRPVNNLVDITNFVMLELGQPLHAFDLAFLDGDRIVVRTAEPGEPFETLDHRKRELVGGELLICDAAKPVGLAGVMGGVNSEIVDSTTSVLLEAANFDMVSIRRTARLHKLTTDASARFGRGLDAELCGQANARATELILQICPEATVRSVQDVYPNPLPARTLEFEIGYISTLLGMEIPTETVEAVLDRLSFSPVYDSQTGMLAVTVPSWRSDVTIREDIVEEVARIVGYDHLPATLISGASPVVERDRAFLAERAVRDLLTGSGACEGRGYVTISARDAERWGFGGDASLAHGRDGAQLVRLRNAIPAEDDILRPSILPRLVTAVVNNLKHETGVRLFEIGHVYLGTGPNTLPLEPSTVGIALAGQRHAFDRFHPRPTDDDTLDYFDAKGMAEAVLDAFRLTDITWTALAHPALHPGRAASIEIGEELIGIVGELHPQVANTLGFEGVRVAVAELNLERIIALADARKVDPVKVARFLPVEQDFAVIVDRTVSASSVEQALRRNAGPLLTGLTLFDVFEGAQIGDDKRSLAFRLTFTAPDRALTDAELTKVRKKIERGLQAQVQGSLRA
ncbi:MAG TPA: phenylalanine--tRNA ligase subunit beta [Thermomicrobiales bacterium]|nr:phenylalanine--tRNA ligase subunit beta [Thermomicrobiales bacterium]